MIIFLSQAKRESQRALLQSKASNPPISAKAAQVDLGNLPRTLRRFSRVVIGCYELTASSMDELSYIGRLPQKDIDLNAVQLYEAKKLGPELVTRTS